ESVIVSTCNRVEVYGVAEVPGEARATVFRHLCHQRGLDPAAVDACLYTHVDRDAVSHTFRVAASLDSMMIGEPQILGQVKDAFALAQACEAVGPALHSLFTHAFAVAKKVRTETDVGRYAVSVSFAAVELAKKIFDGLSGRTVLLVGAGKMGELAARHLVEQGAFPIYVANRTWSRALEMARALSGTAVPFDELATALASADIVITSTGGRRCPRPGGGRPPWPPGPAAVLHRHRGAAERRGERGTARGRLLLRHRRPQARRRRQPSRAPSRGPARRDARRARGRQVPRAPGRRRRDPDHRVAP